MGDVPVPKYFHPTLGWLEKSPSHYERYLQMFREGYWDCVMNYSTTEAERPHRRRIKYGVGCQFREVAHPGPRNHPSPSRGGSISRCAGAVLPDELFLYRTAFPASRGPDHT